jgi:tyrosyl-tRNA synthetase
LPGLSEPAAAQISQHSPFPSSSSAAGVMDEPLSSDSNTEKTFDSKVFSKMSKSNPSSSILIHDSEQDIYHKINKSYCPLGTSKDNPVLEIIKYIIFHQYDELIVERPSKYGGNMSYRSYDEIKKDYEQNKIHPKDLKLTTSKYLNEIISPVRDYLHNKLPDSML